MPPQYTLLLLYSQIELYWLLLLFYQLATTFYHYQKQDNKKTSPEKAYFLQCLLNNMLPGQHLFWTAHSRYSISKRQAM